MLRMAAFALCFGALGACTQGNPDPVGLVVRADDGVAMGRVAAVERASDGRIVAAEIPGLEPADAPADATEMVAEDERFWVRTNASATSARLSALR